MAVPASMLLAGCILLFTGAETLSSPWHPQTIALAHVGTIGVLLIGMFGALYQMIPVVAGTPVPGIRLAHGVLVLLLIGLAGFAWRMFGGPDFVMTLASYSLGIALLGFLLPVGWSLISAATRNETTQGMRIAVIALAAIATMGLIMAQGYASSGFGQSRFLWAQVHLTLALLGWVGGLIMSVSWQVVPMFYLAAATATTSKRILLAALVTGLVLPFVAFVAGDEHDSFLSAAQWAAAASIPAALTIWVAHPMLTLHGLAKRKRRRGDASLLFWRTGLISALLLFPMAVVAFTIVGARWQILFGWFAIWGWAGMILHGMLTRIVPFLVWFHRVAPQIGKINVVSVRGLLSQQRIKIGFALHLASLALGAVAIITQADVVARMTGALLLAAGISLGGSLAHVLAHSGRAAPE